MTGRATARAIIARMIVRSEKPEQRIVQPGFLQTKKNRVGAIERAESPLGQTIPRPAVRLFTGWKSELRLLFAAFLEDAQNVSRVAQVETRQRLDEGQNAALARVFGR